MRKLTGIIAVACLVAIPAALLAVTAKDAPDQVTIDDCQAKKAPVAYPHGKHAAILECKTCHHTQPDLKAGTDQEVKNCASCHVTPEKAETPICSQMSPSKNPYHLVCIKCHKAEIAKDATKKLPTKCDECHPKA